ncbi:MAG: gamma-glutamyl-gamma-aminobutyrate hydrolase family protein [Ignavibacteriales bacterium]|nr:gamma-glutamyl-gamma-aminobutyrate hydrolase family protein [Ignavibacteriales bacterium]
MIRKNILISLIFCVIIFIDNLYPQNIIEKQDSAIVRIAIVNPGVGSIKTFDEFQKNGIIKIPKVEFVAVVYKKAQNQISAIEEMLKDTNYAHIELRVVDGELDKQNLFYQNDCSDDFADILNSTDGILFLGGDDIYPSIYHEKTSFLTNTNNPYRHYFELSFLYHLLGGFQNENYTPLLEQKPNYVIYGFCLGMQTMNVATGGSLHQDIPTDIYGLKYVEDLIEIGKEYMHRNYYPNLYIDDGYSYPNLHQIKFLEDTKLLEELGFDNNYYPYVYSHHHQAAKNVGKNFSVVATTLDGKVVEAIQNTKYKNVLGVQFHPEVSAIYFEDGKKYKIAPTDIELFSYHQFMEDNNSYEFHLKFWERFSKLFAE